MGNHRAPRTALRGEGTPNGYSSAGKRKAAKHSAPRRPLASGLPSAPILLGVAALAVSATGAATVSTASDVAPDAAPARFSAPANALGGDSVTSTSLADEQRTQLVSRDSARDALTTAATSRLETAAEARADERSAELNELAKAARSYANELEANRWVLPLARGTYRISEGFGEGYEWRGYGHTGIDMAAPSGSKVFAVASGVITTAGYGGGCGNMIIQRLDDGTELKYCHNSKLAVSSGAAVRAGDVIAYVGSTGRSTGPHVHLEVAPGGGDSVDPYAALVAHGAQP